MATTTRSKVRNRNVVMLHGYGGEGGEGGMGFEKGAPAGFDWYAPSSPRRMMGIGGPGGHAWWYWDFPSMEHRLLEGYDFSDAIDPLVTPVGLPSMTNVLLDYLAKKPGGPANTVLGGLSQGAIAALDTALYADRPPAGLILMSGGVVGADNWNRQFHRLVDVPVLITHGVKDNVLPFEGSKWLAMRLEEEGADVTFVPFEKGGHTAPPPALVHAWLEMVF